MGIDFCLAVNLRPSLGGFEARNIAKINYFGGPRQVDRRWATPISMERGCTRISFVYRARSNNSSQKVKEWKP